MNFLKVKIRHMALKWIISFLMTCSFTCVLADYQIGVGMSDVTGPVVEIPFMGYAKVTQKGTGLHLRQYARAFIIDDGNERIVFVSVEVAMIGHGLRKKVLQLLQKEYGNLYNEQNIILSATHTHSAPGGFMMDFFFDFTSLGFVKETFNALVLGIFRAITKAHRTVQNAKIFMNSGILLNANINRSPAAYELNPIEERNRYNYDVEKEMTQLKFVAYPSNTLIGAINWFPVHPTSMHNTNTLVSSDNVGYASILLEKHINKGNGSFVATFASSNFGDASPNIDGAYCEDTRSACDGISSTCNGNAQLCKGRGPGRDMFDSTRIIAQRLYTKGRELLEDGHTREIVGKMKVIHRYVDMSKQVTNVTLPNGTNTEVRGCSAAMGYSFAAGTTDGDGEFDFKQGTIKGNVMWNSIRNLIAEPTSNDIMCHYPKPILFATGKVKVPYRWQSNVISVQAILIGDLVLAAVPGEFTTMAGRRLKNSIIKVMKETGGIENGKVIILGLCNTYSDYVTTFEEYQLQRYEGASTVFGPHTLKIYQNLYENLVQSLIKNLAIESHPEPSDISQNLISLIPPVIFDLSGWGEDFGNCIKQPISKIKRGNTVIAEFVAGNPRNSPMLDKTFLSVERMISQDEWTTVATDADWETKFLWSRTHLLTGKSKAIVEWYVDFDVSPGIYRIRHFGYFKYIFGGIYPYEGLTNNFEVL